MSLERRPAAARQPFLIDQQPVWRTWLLFGMLVLLLYAVVWLFTGALVALFAPFLGYDASAVLWGSAGLAVRLVVAVGIALVYWCVSRLGARDRLVRAMHGRPLDPGDRYHRRLGNIVEEMRLATGTRRLDAVVVPTLGMNAFAVSDLKGGGCVGVTEGALARLSRPQLQGVVAYEVAHLLSGDSITTTTACLLFGLYSEIGDLVDDVAGPTAELKSPVVVALQAFVGGFLMAMELAATVVNAALSRDRHCRADAAAARYTRDPVSLAQALRMISRHPGGMGYIPTGLGPLCIRPPDVGEQSALARLTDPQPSLENRIARLLLAAHIGYEEFDQLVAEAEGNLAQREHSAAAPGITPALAPAGEGAADERCPGCGVALTREDYEACAILVCRVCGGRLATTSQVQRLIARREVQFTDGQRRLAVLVLAEADKARQAAARQRCGLPSSLRACPRCGSAMLRRMYDYDHAIEVDYCSPCDVFWFEKDELEVLQFLFEQQAT